MVLKDFGASFWLKAAIHKASQRDCLDALYDAEALVNYCKARARESGIKLAA